MSETEATNTSPDPRTAEVLRALQRARGMVANAAPLNSAPVAARSPEPEPPPLRGVPANCGRASHDVVVDRLTSSVRFLHAALVAANDKLTEFQKSQDCTVRELQESVQGLKHQADVLARWHAWRTRRVAAWGVVLGVLVGAVVALSWQTRAVALRTHAVLEQILENQAHIQAAKVQAQAVKGGRRR